MSTLKKGYPPSESLKIKTLTIRHTFNIANGVMVIGPWYAKTTRKVRTRNLSEILFFHLFLKRVNSKRKMLREKLSRCCTFKRDTKRMKTINFETSRASEIHC